MQVNMRISLREKISYGLGDVACNIVWGATMAFLTFYYTNVVGIAAAAAGTIMLISRVFDGISDVIMGRLIDNTKTKFGKARPWILWMAGPFALAAFLLFAVPRDWSDTAKVVYAFLTYNLMSTVVYTAINLPYGVMNAMMTDNLMDRTQLNIFRMLGSILMGVAANMLVIPMVRFFGGNETEPRGWTLTFLMLGIIAGCLFLLCFFGTKERIILEKKSNKKVSFKTSVPPLFKNKFWVICLITGVTGQMGASMIGINPYFAQYILGDVEIAGLMAMITLLPMLAGLAIASPIINNIGKRNAIMYGAIFSIVGFIIQAINPYNFLFIMVGGIIRGLCTAPAAACGFAMFADVIDYHEWQTGKRTEGMVYSAASFGQKVGAGLGAAALGWILAIGSFNSELITQPSSAINSILFLYIWFPLLMQVINIIFLTQYTLDKIYPQIIKEVYERRDNQTGGV